MTKLAFLGLGVMGYPMAGHLFNAGHNVKVYNRTTSKAVKWTKEYGGNYGKTPSEASDGVDIVIACVGNDDDLRSVCLGEDGAFSSMKPGSLFIDHTTVSAAVTKELHDIAKSHGISFVDAPVSGGQAGAENGQLSIMCGGSQNHYIEAEKNNEYLRQIMQKNWRKWCRSINKNVQSDCYCRFSARVV